MLPFFARYARASESAVREELRSGLGNTRTPSANSPGSVAKRARTPGRRSKFAGRAAGTADQLTVLRRRKLRQRAPPDAPVLLSKRKKNRARPPESVGAAACVGRPWNLASATREGAPFFSPFSFPSIYFPTARASNTTEGNAGIATALICTMGCCLVPQPSRVPLELRFPGS